MKTRIGFVSNSSTTSFLIYGTYLTGDALSKVASALGWIEESSYSRETTVTEALYKKANDLYTARPPYDEGVYLGISWDKIGDDETGAQFKKRAEDTLKQLLGSDLNITFGTLEEAWHD